MSLYFKIILVLILLVYVISPYDFLPDSIPLLGRLDDLLLAFLLVYYLMTQRLPKFLDRTITGAPDDSMDENEEAPQKKSFTAESNGSSIESGMTPYEILGVSKDATFEEIQSAYRKSVKAYHPDKVSHLGKEFQDLANQKIILIQNAYQFLKTKHPH